MLTVVPHDKQLEIGIELVAAAEQLVDDGFVVLPYTKAGVVGGIMLGLGETREQVLKTLQDLRDHDVDMITIGQYLQPTPHHHPVIRYWTPEEFKEFEVLGMAMGFTHVASGPMVRSAVRAWMKRQQRTSSS